MPNTKVPIGPATFSGFVAAFGWLVWHKFYIGSAGWLLARQDKVFGAFASVPMFMIWLYVCWIIVLFGAEFTFAIQRFGTFAREHRAGQASGESRILLTFAVLVEMGKNLLAGGRAFDAETYAQQHSVPIRLLNEVIDLLQTAGLAGALADRENQQVLLRSPDQIPVKDVIDLLIRDGASPNSLGVAGLDPLASHAWRDANQGMADALQQRTILDLIQGEAEVSA
jgi:membrane protein